MRAITRDDGHLRGPQGGVPSARRRRVVHSVTTRRLPLKPLILRRRQSSAPLRQPASHSWSSLASHGANELMRTRNTSLLSPRTIRRTTCRLQPVRRTISLIGVPRSASAYYTTLLLRSCSNAYWDGSFFAERPVLCSTLSAMPSWKRYLRSSI